MLEDYLMLTIHRDDHHCGSCWESGDESDEFIIEQSEDAIIKQAARSIVFHKSKRMTFCLRAVKGVEIHGSINILHDPKTQEHYGTELPFEAARITGSTHYIEAMAEKERADIEAKKQRELDMAEDAKKAALAKEAAERKKLEELKAKYEV